MDMLVERSPLGIQQKPDSDRLTFLRPFLWSPLHQTLKHKKEEAPGLVVHLGAIIVGVVVSTLSNNEPLE